jgi:hypothetical protein
LKIALAYAPAFTQRISLFQVKSKREKVKNHFSSSLLLLFYLFLVPSPFTAHSSLLTVNCVEALRKRDCSGNPAVPPQAERLRRFRGIGAESPVFGAAAKNTPK